MRFDIETRIGEEASDELRLWLRLQCCHNKIQSHIRNQLRLQFNTTLPRFELMAQLASRREGIKMGELSSLLMVSNGNVTTIASQLENDQLIERIVDQADRRSTFVRLTTRGLRQYNKIAKAYDSWLTEAFAGISDAQTKKLYKSLSELKESLDKVVKSD